MSAAGDLELARDYDELASMLGAMRDEARRFRALFETAPSPLLVTDRTLKIAEANAAVETLLDVPLRFLLGKPLPAFVDPAARRAFRAWELELAHRNGSAVMPVRMRRRTGVPFDALVRAEVHALEIHWSISDRTEEVLAEARLWELNRELETRVHEQAAELELLIAKLPVGVMLLRPDGTVGWANERAHQLLLRTRVNEGDPGWRALHGEAVHGERIQAVDADGRPVVLDLTAAPLPAERGGALVVVADATERDLLERADAEFVQNAAHQLRNPITAIASSIAALDAGARDEPEERERFLAHIGRESRRMVMIVESLLSLASLQGGSGRPLVELVPLRSLLEDVLDAVALESAAVDCGDEIAVVGDRELLAQALGNVVANAAEQAGPEGVRVRAELDGATAIVDVTDTGPGVPAADRDRIFERFYRSSSSAGTGSGLGLAIARTAAEATRAKLELLPDRQDEGATFRLTLPGARLL